jgi:hypothetical protein
MTHMKSPERLSALAEGAVRFFMQGRGMLP